MFSESISLSEFMRKYYSVLSPQPPHTYLLEDCENDQLRFCVFVSSGVKTCTVWRHYSAWVRRSICWSVGGTERQTCVWVQPTLCNTSITITRLILNIAQYHLPWKWENYAWIQFYICGSFLFSCCVCFLFFFFFSKLYHRFCGKAGCLKGKLTGNSCIVKTIKWDVCDTVLYVWTWYFWLTWIPAG